MRSQHYKGEQKAQHSQRAEDRSLQRINVRQEHPKLSSEQLTGDNGKHSKQESRGQWFLVSIKPKAGLYCFDDDDSECHKKELQ